KYISDNFEEIRNDNDKEKKVYAPSSIRNIIEKNAHISFDFEYQKYVYGIINYNNIQFDIIYKDTFTFNAGAFKVIINLINDSANVIVILEFLKKYFSFDIDPIQLYSIEDIKKLSRNNMRFRK